MHGRQHAHNLQPNAGVFAGMCPDRSADEFNTVSSECKYFYGRLLKPHSRGHSYHRKKKYASLREVCPLPIALRGQIP